MLAPDAQLYLPISDRMIAPVVDADVSMEAAIAPLSVAQIAALVVMQYLPKLDRSRVPSPEFILAEVIRAGTAQCSRDGIAVFKAESLRILDRQRIRDGLELLSDFGIVLLDDEAAASRRYLVSNHQWDSGFRERHSERLKEPLQHITLASGKGSVLTQEQSRIFREVKSQADDHLHVQGYAGTGKSYLIRSLLAMLQDKGGRILVLAERQRQLDALLPGINRSSSVFPRRFDQLVSEMIPQDFTNPVTLRMARTNYSPAALSDEAVIKHLGVQSCGRFTPLDMVRAIRSTVAAFCFSGDADFESKHIPDWCSTSFDDVAKRIVLHHATELWKAILWPPSRDFQPPLRGYHRIKWAALNGCTLPAHYTHVLIDECHDLRKPMLQILDSSSQVVISLGDEYQNLQGTPQWRARNVRHRLVSHSVRSGPLIEGVVNPIIAAHPGITKLPFHGNPAHRTQLVYYDRAHVPEQPTTILVSDSWSLFEWAQRLAAENVVAELLSSRIDLNMFVNDCIELYLNGSRARHGELFRFDSWRAVAASHHHKPGFQRIDRMLQRGYRSQDWAKTYANLTKRSTNQHALGFIRDVRNRQFEKVMLTPDVAEHALGHRGANLAAIGSSIYVAVTRASRLLLAPASLRNWIEDIASPTVRIERETAIVTQG